MWFGRQPLRSRWPAAAALPQWPRCVTFIWHCHRPFATSAAGGTEKRDGEAGRRSGTEKRAVGLAWDLETTGFQPCEIVQIAVTCADWDAEPHSSFVRFVMPTRYNIQRQAAAVHGITKTLLAEKGAALLPVMLGELAEWLDSTFGADRRFVWAAHNGQTFDLPVLRKCCAAAGAPLPRGLEESAHTVDTLPLARQVLSTDALKNGANLSALFQQATGTPLADAHDALIDAKALAKVWLWLVQHQSADPRSAVFEDYLACIHMDGPALKPGACGRKTTTQKKKKKKKKKKKSAEEMWPDELQSLAGLGPVIEAQLRELGVDTVTELRDTIAKAGLESGVTPYDWLKSHLKAHPGALSKIRDALAEETVSECKAEETPAATAAVRVGVIEEVWKTRYEWGPKGLAGLKGRDDEV